MRLRLAASVAVAVICVGTLGCPGGGSTPTLQGTTPPSPSADDSILVFGTAPPQSVVQIFAGNCGGSILGQGTTAESGSFSVPVSVPRNATTVLRATATVGGGAPSECSNGLSFTHDGTVPMVTLTGTSPASPSNVNDPEVLGQSEPGARVKVYGTACTGTPLAQGMASTTGSFRIKVVLPNNATTLLFADATDAAGNLAPCAGPLIYDEVSVVVPSPGFNGTQPGSPSSSSSPILSGVAPPNTQVKLYGQADCMGPILYQWPMGSTDRFLVQVVVPENATTLFTATAQDVNGNVSACSLPFPYIEDSIAPAAPVATGISPASPSRISQVTITGTAEPSSTVGIWARSDCATLFVGNGTAGADGSFAASGTVPTNTTTSFYARTTDPAGNKSSCVATSLQYMHDDVKPTVGGYGDGLNPGDIAFQAVTDRLSAHWSGSDNASGLARYEYSATTGVCPGTVVLPRDMGLQTSVTVTGLTLAERSYKSCIRAYDLAGNVSNWFSTDGVVVDVTPPVPSFSPANGETEVSLARPIVFNFNEPVPPSSLVAGGFRLLKGGTPVSAAVAVRELYWDSVTLTPSASLERSAVYTVEVQAGAIADQAGNPVSPYTTTFTTAPYGFEAQQGLEAGSDNVERIKVAAGSDGSAITLWVHRNSGGAYEVWAAVAAAGATFGAPVRMDTVSTGFRPVLAVSVEQGGAGWVAWSQPNASSQRTLRIRRFEPAGGWQPSVEFAAASSTTNFTEAFLVESGGQHVLTWGEQPTQPPYRQLAARWSSASGWSAPVLLGAGTGAPRAAVDAAGRAVAAWVEANVLKVSRSAAGASWDAPVTIDAPAGLKAYGPRVGFAPSGTATVAWRRADLSDQQVGVMFSQAAWGASFAAPTLVATPVVMGTNSALVELAVAGDGSALVVWNEDYNGVTDHARFFSRWWSGSSWGPVQEARWCFSDTFRLAVGGNGQFIAACKQEQTGGYVSDFFFNRYRPGSGWTSFWEVVATGEPWSVTNVVDEAIDLASVGDGRAFLVETHPTVGLTGLRAFAHAYR